MSVSIQLEVMAGKLQGYQAQVAAISKALEAMKVVSEMVGEALASDRATILELIDEAQHVPAAIAAGLQADAVGEAVSGATETFAFDAVANGTATDGEETVSAFEPSVLEPGLTTDLPEITAVADAAYDQDVSVSAPQDTPAETGVASPAVAQEGAVKADESKDVVTVSEDIKVIDLAARRAKSVMQLPSKRRMMGYVAALVLAISATVGAPVLMESELAQRLIELGACDGDALSANTDCAVLAWLLL